jgi:putative PEP-CTERM system TPR-repeat lipoprotein
MIKPILLSRRDCAMTIHPRLPAISSISRTSLVVLLAFCFALSGCAEKQTPDAYVEQGEKFYAEGELGSAVIEFKNALQGNPDHAQARVGLALVYLDMGNGPGAEKELRRALELGVSSDAVLVPMTRTLILQGRFDEIKAQQPDLANLKEAEQAQYYTLLGDANLLSDDPDAAELAYEAALSLAATAGARVGQARVAGVRGEVDLAELQQLLEGVLEDYPDFALAWVQLGDLQHVQGRHEEAEEAFTKAIALRYNNSYEHYRRALVRIGMGEYDAASKDAKVLKQRNSRNPKVPYLLGLIEFKNKEFAAAQVEFEKAVNTDPNFMNAVFYLGATHFYQGSMLQAEQYLSRYHRKFPGSASAVKLLASALYQVGNYNKARKVAMPMLEVMPDDPFLLNLMGNIYMKQGNVDDAMSSLQKLQEQRPEDSNLHAQIGLGLMATGNYGEGTDELQHAVELAQDDHEAEIALVMVYLRTDKPDKAVEVAQTLSDKYPDNPSMKNMVGVTHLANKEPDAARSAFLEALKLAPGNPGAAHNLATMEIQEGSLEQARAYYAQVLEQDPGHLRTLLKLAQLEVTQDNYDKSLEWLQVAIEKNPNELSPRLHLAREYLRGGQADRARGLLTPAILNDHKDEPALLVLLSDIELANGEPQEAAATLEDLARLLPSSAEAQYLLAKAYATAGNEVKSRAALQKALALDPNHVKSRISQMRKLVAAGQVEQAQKILDVMVSKYPEHPEVIAQQAWFEGQTVGNTQEAVTNYEKAYALTPVRELAIELSRAHLKNNDPQSGTAVLEDWVANNPEDAAVWSSLGNIYLVTGEEKKAIAAYESTLAVDPENELVLNNLAWILRESEPKTAMSYAQKAYDISPESAVVMDTMGVILLHEGETGRALDLLSRSTELEPGNLDTRYHLSQALVENGDKAAAKEMLQELLSEDGNFSERKNAARLLKSL